jgi:ribosomal protein S18 acetylase RimI-like enzyme
MEDAAEVLAIFHTISLKYVGEIEETLEELLETWSEPELDRERDTRVVVHPDGRIVGYAIFDDAGRPEMPYIDVYLHPDEWDRDAHTIPFLFAWLDERARENLVRVAADVRVALRGYTHNIDHFYKAALTAAGYTEIRHSFRMQIDFVDTPTPPALSEGFTYRTLAPDEDWHGVFDCFRDAWRDHYGYIERPYDEHFAWWSRRWQDNFEPHLWYLALDGDTVAAICLCHTKMNDDPAFGWVSTLAVRRAYRRRGLGEALLRQSFVGLYAAGSRRVGLGVDASSLTGATALYEKAGMHVQVLIDLYEKVLREGIDTTTSVLVES